MTLGEPEVAIRSDFDYKSLCGRYVVKDRNYSVQYAPLYATRLRQLTPAVLRNVKLTLGNDVKVTKLADLPSVDSPESLHPCVVIGTLFKHQGLKPSILKEISDEHNLEPQPIALSYVADDDELILEDESQRIKLVGDVDIPNLVTGVVAAAYGCQVAGGCFNVKELVFGGDYYQKFNKFEAKKGGEDKYVMLVSGLRIGEEQKVEYQILLDFLKGVLPPLPGIPTEKIVKVIVAGNSLISTKEGPSEAWKTKADDQANFETLRGSLAQLDLFFAELASVVDVDVIPGETDPGNFQLPQLPMHACLFPRATAYPTFRAVTNPYESLVDGVKFLGTAGNNVKDLRRVSTLDSAGKCLEAELRWAHVAPTCPDTLGCYPFTESDPLVVDELPNVFFCGNQELEMKFVEKKLAEDKKSKAKVLLLSLPTFMETKEVVFVNLKNLETEVVNFRALIDSFANL